MTCATGCGGGGAHHIPRPSSRERTLERFRMTWGMLYSISKRAWWCFQKQNHSNRMLTVILSCRPSEELVDS